MTKRGGRGTHLGEPRSIRPGRREKEIIEELQRRRGGRESGGDCDAKCQGPHPVANPAAPKWWHGTPGTLKWAFARIRALEEAERTCKAANESQRLTILALEAELAVAQDTIHGLCLDEGPDERTEDD